MASPVVAEVQRRLPLGMELGLVTYNWGRDWNLAQLIRHCEQTGFRGVELRSTHRHGVEPELSQSKRREVARRFADSPVVLVGLGTACEYHSPDPDRLKRNIEQTKAFVLLCHDVGGSGIKVRPNGLPRDVPQEKTIAQIGKALNQVAAFGQDYGVQIRLEVHGRGTADLPVVARIMQVADHPNVTVCWNSNPTDLKGKGLEHNFRLVASRLGDTVHIHDLISDYPWLELFRLLKKIKYRGWLLVEEGRQTSDPLRVMKYYRALWQYMLALA